MLGLVQVDVTERSGRAEVKTAIRAATRCGATTAATSTCRSPTRSPRPPARAHDRLDLRQHPGDRHQGGPRRSTRSAATCTSPAPAASPARRRSPGDVEIVDTQIDGALEAPSVSGNVAAAESHRAADRRSAPSAATSSSRTCSASASRPFGQRQRRVRRRARQERPLRAELALGQRPRRRSAGDTGFELEANSFSGSVRSDLPITMRAATAASAGGAARSAASTATAARCSTSRPSRAASSFPSGKPTRDRAWISDSELQHGRLRLRASIASSFVRQARVSGFTTPSPACRLIRGFGRK